MGKRINAGILAVLWTLLSLAIPASAHAVTYNAASSLSGRQFYVPLAGGPLNGFAGSQVVATAATMLGRANPWIAAITLGTPVMQYLLEKNGGDRVAIRARDAPVATPAGWTATPSGIPSPPTTSPVIASQPYQATASGRAWSSTYYPDDRLGFQEMLLKACQRSLVVNMSPPPTCNVVSVGPSVEPPTAGSTTTSMQYTCSYMGPTSQGGSCELLAAHGNNYTCPQGGTLNGTTCMPDPSCSPGYTLSQGYCTIVDPTAVKWPADGVPTYVPTLDGSGLQADPRDPDAIPQTPSPAEIMNPSKQYGNDPYGNPTSTTITPQSGGGYKIDQRVQTTNNNQTTTTINNLTINNLGNVTNISSTTVPGSIEQASPTATPVAQKIEFPTDYNRENTQLAVKSKLDEIHAGTGAANAPNYDVAAKAQAMNDELKVKSEAIPGQYAGDKGNWFSWVWTPPVGNCSPWESTIHGQSVSWNVCPYVDKIRDAIGYMLAVVSAIAVYSQLFRRED